MVVIGKTRLKKNTFIPLLVNLTGLILAVFFQSRSFFVGFTVSLLLFFVIQGKQRLKKSGKNFFIAFCLSAITTFLVACFFKHDSSSGRLLIYKISLKIFSDHWLTGTGLGSFGREYLNYQAAYFAKGNFMVKELLLADNTKHAFNDYLQWSIETGLPGILLLIAILLLIIYLFIKSIGLYQELPAILLVSLSLLSAISTAACFTHIFELICFQLLFVISLTVLTYFALEQSRKQVITLSISTIAMIIWLGYGTFIINYKRYEQFKVAKELYATGYIRDALKNFEELYPYLQQDIQFLSIYADLLITTENNIAAEQILKKLIYLDNSYFFHFRLADNYQISHEFNKAETEYIKAVNMVPNRFISRDKLFHFYCNTRNTEKALITAQQIMDLPVKISSPEVNRIKRAIKKYLEKHSVH